MIKHVTVAIALLAVPLSGCAESAEDSSSTTTSGSAAAAQSLTTQLKTADGKAVADATIDFSDGYATVTVETVETGVLSPGLHGLHVHAVGKCEGDFASAGDHFQAPGHSGEPASGDLPALLVRSDGAGKLVATTDGFTEDQLKGPNGSAIVLHQSADMGADSAADQRLACGVLSPASASGTSVSTSTSVSTVTAPPQTTVPPATVTETATSTPTSTPATTSASGVPTTDTSTVTVTQPTLPDVTVPPLPGPEG